jgi:hypothetical protein
MAEGRAGASNNCVAGEDEIEAAAGAGTIDRGGGR